MSLPYFARYRQKLEPLIGAEAAAATTAYFRWVVGLAGFIILVYGFAMLAAFGPTVAGWIGAGVSFIAMIACIVRIVVLGSRGGKLAADHLSQQFGHPVRNHGVKVSLRWWHEYVAAEGITRRDKRWQRRT